MHNHLNTINIPDVKRVTFLKQLIRNETLLDTAIFAGMDALSSELKSYISKLGLFEVMEFLPVLTLLVVKITLCRFRDKLTWL